jgi:alkylation response protein AidB-like acyl-CoA dehydrogenase
MDFVYSEEQQMLRDGVDRYGGQVWPAAKRLRMIAEGPDGARRRWREMAELGWFLLAIPEAQGGLGGGPIDIMAVMEGFGRRLMTGPYVSTCVLAPALLEAGGEGAEELLTAIGAGEAFVGAGLIEPDGAYDLHRVSTRAERDGGGGYRLSGVKAHVEDGADADFFIVSARTGGGTADADGLSLFLVAADAPGLRVDRFRSVDHHRHARLTLEGVTHVTQLGAADGALPVIVEAVDRAICGHLAEATGSMEAAAEATLEYLRTRRQFGVIIGSFQALQHRMVDMQIACEEARAMTYQATLSLHHGAAQRRRAVSAAKTRVGQSGVYVGQQAVQLHGGVGFSEELIVSHHLRRQMMLDIAHGSADHHRALFAAAH